jgi:hypothetical protein
LQVTYLAVTSGKDVAEKARNVTKKLMTDQVQLLFNYEGRGSKQKKPLKKLKQLISLISGMQTDVITHVNIISVRVKNHLKYSDCVRHPHNLACLTSANFRHFNTAMNYSFS